MCEASSSYPQLAWHLPQIQTRYDVSMTYLSPHIPPPPSQIQLQKSPSFRKPNFHQARNVSEIPMIPIIPLRTKLSFPPVTNPQPWEQKISSLKFFEVNTPGSGSPLSKNDSQPSIIMREGGREFQPLPPPPSGE